MPHQFDVDLPFEEAFPTVAGAWVNITEFRYNAAIERTFRTQDNIAEAIPCTNFPCVNGGFEVFSRFEDMVRKQETSRNIEAECEGVQSAEYWAEIECMHRFKGTITITYKIAPSDEPTK